MYLNLDLFEISDLILGSANKLPDGNHSKGCLSFFIQDSFIKNINVRLSEFYSKGEIFKGSLIVNNNKIEVNGNFQPQNIVNQFANQIEHWDDGVEVNYQFQVGKVTIEFSWHWSEQILVLNYICIEQN